MSYHMPFGNDDGQRLWRAGEARPKPAFRRRHYSMAGLIARLIIVPPLLTVLVVAACLLGVATINALGDYSVIFVLPALAVVAATIVHHAGPNLVGSFALLAWCGFLALVWGAVGVLIWAL